MIKLIKILLNNFNRLPLSLRFLCADTIGYFIYLFSFKKRFVSYRNIKLVFPTKSNRDILKIYKKSIINFSRSVIETLYLVTNDTEYLEKHVDISQSYSLTKDKPHVFVAIHEGSWEILNCAVSLRYNYAILARQQKNNTFNNFIEKVRLQYGLRVVYSLKEIIKLIKKNFWIGIVVDHGAERNAQVVEFFGQLVPTPGGAYFLARKYNLEIYPCYIVRNKKFYHKLYIGNPIKGDSNCLRNINMHFEKYIREFPGEYMWWYKRFKRKRNVEILILNDRRVGHTRQAYSLVEAFKEKGYKVNLKEVSLEYKSVFHRFILNLCALFSSKWCLGCGRCISFCLKKDSYLDLYSNYADIVISAGSFNAPINAIFSQSIGAKSINILKSNLSYYKFDLNIIPQHDQMKKKKNVVFIKGALSFPDLESINLCKESLKLSSSPKISLFIGGSIKKTRGTQYLDNLKRFLDNLKEYSLDKKYKLLITTSRRTPKYIEDYVEDYTKNWDNLESLIIANRKNFPFVSWGFLGLSEEVFISGDSVSMLVESLTLNKITFAVVLEDLPCKHKKVLYNLFKEELINILDYPYDIGSISIKKPSYSIFDYNKKIMSEAIGRLL